MLTRPTVLLRLEAAILFAATIIAYIHWGHGWVLFAVLFLTPDLFMLGYLANPQLGSALYNLGHFVALPLLLLAYGYQLHSAITIAVALIWASHIEFDRMVGYGLKYPTFFKDTHLSRA